MTSATPEATPIQAEGLDELERLAKAVVDAEAALEAGGADYQAAGDADEAFYRSGVEVAVLSLIQQARASQAWRDRALAAEGREAALRGALSEAETLPYLRAELEEIRDTPSHRRDVQRLKREIAAAEKLIAEALTPEANHG